MVGIFVCLICSTACRMSSRLAPGPKMSFPSTMRGMKTRGWMPGAREANAMMTRSSGTGVRPSIDAAVDASTVPLTRSVKCS